MLNKWQSIIHPGFSKRVLSKITNIFTLVYVQTFFYGHENEILRSLLSLIVNSREKTTRLRLIVSGLWFSNTQKSQRLKILSSHVSGSFCCCTVKTVNLMKVWIWSRLPYIHVKGTWAMDLLISFPYLHASHASAHN